MKLGRLTDYGIVMMTHLALAGEVARFSSRELAAKSQLPYPTVSKILKLLHKAHLLISERGVSGGYSLARPARAISIVDIIVALEGPVAITLCASEGWNECLIAGECPIKSPLQMVNTAVTNALKSLSLADMMPARCNGTVQKHVELGASYG